MNRKRAKELLPVITAFAEGKAIQYKNRSSDYWNLVPVGADEDVHFIHKLVEYRVAPEPKLRE